MQLWAKKKAIRLAKWQGQRLLSPFPYENHGVPWIFGPWPYTVHFQVWGCITPCNQVDLEKSGPSLNNKQIPGKPFDARNYQEP